MADVGGDELPEPLLCRRQTVLDQALVNRHQIRRVLHRGAQIRCGLRPLPQEGLGGADNSVLGTVTFGIRLADNGFERIAEIRPHLAVVVQGQCLAAIGERLGEHLGEILPVGILEFGALVLDLLELGEPSIPVRADVS